MSAAQQETPAPPVISPVDRLTELLYAQCAERIGLTPDELTAQLEGDLPTRTATRLATDLHTSAMFWKDLNRAWTAAPGASRRRREDTDRPYTRAEVVRAWREGLLTATLRPPSGTPAGEVPALEPVPWDGSRTTRYFTLGELAEMHGYTRSAAQAWARREGFPEPDVLVGVTQGWRLETFQWWARKYRPDVLARGTAHSTSQ